jgi:hypothetical protein
MSGSRAAWCFLALPAAFLNGCASTELASSAPEPPAAETQPLAAVPAVVRIEPARLGAAEEPVCRKQNVTGSHRPRVVCQTAEQRSATRAAAQEWYRSRGRTGEISQVPVVP